ncbi:MAG: lysophospholipid acyltransferase family protein [bacterium]|nr:MAG: lysophospholipid acyltransferase family protein [bacterium]
MASLVAMLFYRTLSIMPLRAIHGIGALLGLLLYTFRAEPRKLSEINLGLCFPEMKETDRDRLVRRSLIESSRSFLEMGAFWHMPRRRLEGYIAQETGKEILQKATERGEGLILLLPHLGLWEFSTYYFLRFAPFTALYRPLRLPSLHEYVLAGRQRFGAKLVPTNTFGVRALYKALQRGEFVTILPDQDPHSRARVFAPFFGVPAATMILVGRLARNTGAQVVTAYAERLTGGRGFHLHVARVSDDIYSEDDLVSASAMNRALEECVRRNPDQYLWSYKRFKARPEGTGVDLYRKR